MKLRLSREKLRFRLTPEDVLELTQKSQIQERLELGSDLTWTYGISLTDSDRVRVQTQNSRVEIQLPERDFKTWVDGGELDWDYHQESPALTISIEKDLKPKRR